MFALIIIAAVKNGAGPPKLRWLKKMENGDAPMITQIPELTVNWHILEPCNFKCNFCYAVYPEKRSSFTRDYAKVLVELSKLKGKLLDFASGPVIADSIRVNFAGGEPFLYEEKLREAISLSHYLGLKPSFITNGSLISDEFIKKFGPMISVAGFSVDSFDVQVNERIGRQDNKRGQLTQERLSEIFQLFRKVSPGTKLKINTVVCRENIAEDLSQAMIGLAPDRWKLLRVVPIHGAKGRGVTDRQYKAFIDRNARVTEHSSLEFITEDNDEMHRSYVMLDPQGCFYQRIEQTGSEHLVSQPVVKVGASRALQEIWFDVPTYSSRYTHNDTNK